MRRAAALAIGAWMAIGWEQAARAQSSASVVRGLGEEVARTAIWLAIAAFLFVIIYKIVDWVTPGDLKKQLAEGNTAIAIFSGALILGAAIIIAALVL